jgi:hypothetical protein
VSNRNIDGQAMAKRTGFENDLEALTDDVEANVAGMLQVLSGGQRRTTTVRKRKGETSMDNEGDQQLAAEPSEVRVAEASHRRKIAKSSSITAKTEPINADIPLVNITTRLPVDLNELLTEAALRQRLKRITPATRQGILQVALHDWLHKNGYSG